MKLALISRQLRNSASSHDGLTLGVRKDVFLCAALQRMDGVPSPSLIPIFFASSRGALAVRVDSSLRRGGYRLNRPAYFLAVAVISIWP